MICPNCGAKYLRVIDSRKCAGFIRRRRECACCANRITTIELNIETLRKCRVV